MDTFRKGKDKQMHKFRHHAERHLKAFSAHLKRLRASISLIGNVTSLVSMIMYRFILLCPKINLPVLYSSILLTMEY